MISRTEPAAGWEERLQSSKTRLAEIEHLEPRCMLTNVSMLVFDDVDGNMIRSLDELGLAGWEVTLRSAETDFVARGVSDLGGLRIADVPAGRYEVSVDATDRWEATFENAITVDAAVTEMQFDLGVRLIERLRGRIHSIDTNLDTYVNESDVIQAFKSGKYDTGEPAKREHGDWNGDGRFDTSDLVMHAEAYQFAETIAPDAIDGLQQLMPGGDADVIFRYNGKTGDVSFESDFSISTLQLRTASNVMDFKVLPNEGFLYEIYRPDRIGYLAFGHDRDLQFSQFAAPGLSAATILEHLRIDGSRVGGGGLGKVVLDCVDCSSATQTIVTVNTYEDLDFDGSWNLEPLIPGITVRTESETGALEYRETGFVVPRYNQRGQFEFAIDDNVPATLTLLIPSGWRLQDPKNAVQTLDPTGGPIHLDIGFIREQIRITEVHFNPAADGLAEFIEIANLGDHTVDIAGMLLESGIEFVFPDAPESILQPGQHVVVVKDTDTFRKEYPDASIVIVGEYDGRLSNGGESIRLVSAKTVVHSIHYIDDWHDRADGHGPSLTPIDATLDHTTDASQWRPSAVDGGTPGRPAFFPGDANLDGVFDSADLVDIFRAAEFEDDQKGNSTWSGGDWNGDGDFTTADIILAFQSGKYVS